MLPKSNEPTVEEIIRIFQAGLAKIQTAMKSYHDSLKADAEFTTPLFWDCECTSLYLHLKDEKRCLICGVYQEDQPDSRITEVLLAAEIWYQSLRVDRERLLNQSTAKIFNWKPDNGYEKRPGGEDE